jgi:hypothetical protein
VRSEYLNSDSLYPRVAYSNKDGWGFHYQGVVRAKDNSTFPYQLQKEQVPFGDFSQVVRTRLDVVPLVGNLFLKSFASE